MPQVRRQATDLFDEPLTADLGPRSSRGGGIIGFPCILELSRTAGVGSPSVCRALGHRGTARVSRTRR